MYLIFTDETGTSIQKHTIFLMYGGLAVHESLILKFEMQVTRIVQEFLNIENMLEVEVHFTEIFNYIFSNKKPSKANKLKNFEDKIYPQIKNKTQQDIINFVDELFQAISKFNIPLLFATIDKRDDFHNRHHLQNREISYNAYVFKAFLNIVDRFLTLKNEMGLLVADDFVNQIPKKLSKFTLLELISDKTIKENPKKELIYKRVLAESLLWKNPFINKDIFKKNIAPLKYKFEANSLNILDNINFISSKDSIINQITDILLYTIRKIKEYEDNKEQYQDIKEFCENNDLRKTLRFLYSTEIIKESKIIKRGSDLDVEMSGILSDFV